MSATQPYVFNPKVARMNVIRGTTRYTIQLLILAIITLFITAAWTNVLWFRHTNQLAKQLRGGVISFVGTDGRTVMLSGENFHTTPIEVQQKARAWEIVSLVMGADSTPENRASLNFRKAKLLMTRELGNEFERKIDPTAPDIEATKVRKLVEVSPEDIRPIKKEELPEGRTLEAPGYHYLVKGKLSTFKLEDGVPLFGGRFAYYVNLVPSSKGFTVQDPLGLLVAALVPVQVKDIDSSSHSEGTNDVSR
jgi:hypothetical protein